jgi:glycosyltransferase involved in cell wall biosynthesis
MRIAFFGNTNNSPLIIAQAIQRLGHEVLIVVNSKESLHRPENRIPNYGEKYPEWIMDASQYSEWDYISLDPSIEPVLNVLNTFDALILNDLGPSFLPLLKKPAVSLLTGSDLTYYANYQTIKAYSRVWSKEYKRAFEGTLKTRLFMDCIDRQREGIRHSSAVHYTPPGIEMVGDHILAELGVANDRRFFQFIAELEKITPLPLPNNDVIRVLCPVRITWKGQIEPGRSTLDYKGSDIMIKGLGLFHKKTGAKLEIRMIRKGLHIEDLEQLISEESISTQVTWLDEMPQPVLWEEMARSDIILEQFGQSMVAMVGMDAMASGRPVIGNVRPEILGASMPICQAKTPEEVCAQLEYLVFNQKERERLGKAGREHVEKFANVEDFARRCVKYLEIAILKQKDNELISYNSGLSYYLRQRSLWFEEIADQHNKIREFSEREIGLLRYLNSYDISGANALKGMVLGRPFQRDYGQSWTIKMNDLDHIADTTDSPDRSTLLLFENDMLLRHPHAQHIEIREIGEGRYSHLGSQLYFSTSDNSDPNFNGRRYAVVWLP